MTYTTKDGVKVVLQPKDQNEPGLCKGCYFSEPGEPSRRCSLPDDGSVPEDISDGCFESANLSIWVKAPEQVVTTDRIPLSIPQGRTPGVDSQLAPETALKSASLESHSCQACTHLGNINEKVSLLEDLLAALQAEIAAYKKQLGLMEAPEETNPLSIPRPGARVEAVSMRTITYNGVTLKAVPGETYSCEGCYFNKPAGRQHCFIAAKDLARQCYPEANSGKWIIWTEVKAPT